MKKRVMAMVMALCLALSLMPTAALAEGEGSDEQLDTSVARVDGQYYDSLKDAVAAIKTEGTVELVADAPLDNRIMIKPSQDITLDLGTYTVKPSETFNFGINMLFKNQGRLTIQGNGTIEATGEHFPKIAIEQESNDCAS